MRMIIIQQLLPSQWIAPLCLDVFMGYVLRDGKECVVSDCEQLIFPLGFDDNGAFFYLNMAGFLF